MMKSIALVTFVLCTSLVHAGDGERVNPYGYDMCNPADCPPSSTNCKRCDVRNDLSCALGESPKVGVCIEPTPLSARKSSGQLFPTRCRRATDPNGDNVLKPHHYVKACRELEFTCMDGTCEEVKGVPKNCRKNIIGSEKCDPTVDTELQQLIANLWKTEYTETQLLNVCKNHGGVKYNYLKCDSGFTPGILQNAGECDADSPLKLDVKPCNSDPTTTETHDVECTETEVVASSSSCCLSKQNPSTCKPLVQIGNGYDTIVPPNGGSEQLPAAGIDLELTMERSPERCCCEQTCSCFGDPHCDSLFGAYEVTRGNTGQYDMVNDGNFIVTVTIGDPMGVIDSVDITMTNTERYKFTSDECIASQDKPLYEPLPEGWKFTPGAPGGAANAIYYINDKPTDSVVVVTCVAFKQNIGSISGWHTRMDVEILKNVPLVQGEDGSLCCPPKEEIYDMFNQNDLEGFCMKRVGDDPVLPFGKNSRRLGSGRAMEEVDDGESAFSPLNDKKKSSIVSSAEKTCAKLANKGFGICSDMEKCLVSEMEIGNGGCSNLLPKKAEQLKSVVYESPQDVEGQSRYMGCQKFATNPLFDPSNKGKCDRGVEFQAKKKGTNTWTTLYFFPENSNFCDGKVHINFEHAKINGVSINLNDYDIQFIACSPPEECHLQCIPELDIKELNARFFYPCRASLAKGELFKHALDSCDDCATAAETIECVRKCAKTGVCECPVTPYP